jgi:hypothetical protein
MSAKPDSIHLYHQASYYYYLPRLQTTKDHVGYSSEQGFRNTMSFASTTGVKSVSERVVIWHIH